VADALGQPLCHRIQQTVMTSWSPYEQIATTAES
jgi:hypothetical protein